ncbi:MAG: hypothetical protein QOG19_2818 [Mycobacterium sp.]|nr:hypothetical protein [Mycobacterium sp.]
MQASGAVAADIAGVAPVLTGSTGPSVGEDHSAATAAGAAISGGDAAGATLSAAAQSAESAGAAGPAGAALTAWSARPWVPNIAAVAVDTLSSAAASRLVVVAAAEELADSIVEPIPAKLEAAASSTSGAAMRYDIGEPVH